jgi:hypothetical protein
MEERELNLIEILKRILLGWRMILIFVLIGAIAFGGLGYMKARQEVSSQQEVLEGELTLDSIESLTEREILELEAAIESYKSYYESYQSILSYMTDSIKMNLNPIAVSNVTIQYLVDTHYQTVYPVVNAKDYTEDIIETISSRLLDDAICEKMRDALGWDVDVAYVSELISIRTSATDIMTISILAPDQEGCETIADVLEQEIVGIATEVQAVYGAFDLTHLIRKYTEAADAELLTMQQDQAAALNTVKGTLTGISASLTEEQKRYYDEVLNREIEEDLNEGVEKTQVSDTLKKMEDSKISFTDVLKYIFIGMMLGGFIACTILVCRCLFAGKILCVGDIESAFFAPVLGQVLENSESKRAGSQIDHWIQGLFTRKGSIFTKEEYIRMIVSKIAIEAKKKGIQQVYLTGSVHGDVISEMKLTLSTKLKEQQVQVAYGNSPICDPDALEQMVASDAVVFVEQIDVSRYEDMKKEVLLCEQYQIPVMGYVVV